MKDYSTNTKECRHSLLLAYFGERFAAGRCDSCCDNCLARQPGGAPADDIWLVCCHPIDPHSTVSALLMSALDTL